MYEQVLLLRYEFIGLVLITVLSLEVAIYAILAATASRISRYLFEAGQDTRKRKAELIRLITATEDDFGEKKAFKRFKKDINKKLVKISEPLNKIAFIKANTKASRALVLPVSPLVVGLLLYFLALSSILSYFSLGFVYYPIVILIILSAVFEINVFRAIDHVLRWTDPGDIKGQEKAIDELTSQLKTTPIKEDKKRELERRLNLLELKIERSKSKYFESFLAGTQVPADGSYTCAQCGDRIDLKSRQVFPPCSICNNNQWGRNNVIPKASNGYPLSAR